MTDITHEALEALRIVIEAAEPMRLKEQADCLLGTKHRNPIQKAITKLEALRTGQLIPAPSVDDVADKIMWHVEQVMGPVSREVCINPGDDDYSVLRHNIAACLKAKEQADG